MRYKYVSFLLAVLLAVGIVFAEPWDLTGNWVINVKYLGIDYPETLILTQAGTAITGVSLNTIPPAGGSAFTIASGSVTGNTVEIFADHVPSSLVVRLNGTIAADGSMKGDWADVTPGTREGTWESTSGAATDLDSDDDSVLNDDDNCPLDPNLDQTDTDGDGMGDACDRDDDNDGIIDGDDRCPGTIPDSFELGVNRWMWNGAWVTELPKGEGPQLSFTMEDTEGCSCKQILDKMGGKMMGHRKFGCSISVMEDFISGLPPLLVDTVQVNAIDTTPKASHIALKPGVKYQLEAIGTAFAGGNYALDIEFDAKYSITHSKVGDTWTDSVTDYESYGPTLLDLFVDGASVDWGAYNDQHTYYYTVTGDGTPLDLWIYDIYYPNNSGAITVNIYKIP